MGRTALGRSYFSLPVQAAVIHFAVDVIFTVMLLAPAVVSWPAILTFSELDASIRSLPVEDIIIPHEADSFHAPQHVGMEGFPCAIVYSQ